jgi:hypothetical protein
VKLELNPHLSLLERAFELARSGHFAKVPDVTKQLKQEGYTHYLVDEHLSGRAIRSKIKNLCREAKGKR